MSTKLKRITISILAILFLFSMVALVTFSPKQNVALAQVFDDETLVVENSYVLNTRKSFASSKEVSYLEGNVTATDGVIEYPTGKVVKIEDGKNFTLNSVGTYTIKYFYNDAGKLITFKDDFSVTNAIYNLSDTGGSVTAVSQESMLDKTFANLADDVTVSKNDALIVRLKEGTSFSYAEPIDLSKMGEDGISNIITIDPRVGERSGRYIARTINIKLVDCYDPTIAMTITLYVEDGACYIRTNMDGMESRGLAVPSTWGRIYNECAEIQYGSERGTVWIKRFGTTVGYGLSSTVNSANISLRFDYQKGILYAGLEKQYKSDVTGKSLSGSTLYEDIKKIGKTIIMDFNHKEASGLSEFRNFTTGEVMMTISATDYVNPEAVRFDIMSLGNKNAREMFNTDDCTAKNYQDETAPKIVSEFSPTVNDGVYVGVGTKYEIPSAKAYDPNLVGNVKVKAYRGYKTPYQSSVSIVNNCIDIAKEDTYYIVYSASDIFGNTAEKVVKVYGKDVTNAPIITLDNSNKIPNNTEIGKSILFPLGTKISTINNKEDLKLKIELISNKETVVVADLKNGAEIDEFWARENYFTVGYAGNYITRYTYSDNACSYVVEDTFTTISSSAVTFEGKPFIPRLLLKGATYSFDSVAMFEYSTGAPVFAGYADLYISFDGGAFTKITNISKCQITGSQTAQLKAVKDGVEILSDIAKIKDVNYAAYAQDNKNERLNTVNYFDMEDGAFTVDTNSSNLVLKSTKTSGNNKLRFANIIDYSEFYIAYKIESAYSTFSSIKFTLTDPYDLDNSVVFELARSGATVNFIAGGKTIKLSSDTFGSSNKKEIAYSLNAQNLSFSASATKITMDIPFTTVEAYLDIELCGITGNAGVQIIKLNDQNIRREGTDKVGPTAVFERLVGTFAVDTTITLPAVKYLDVLSVVPRDSVVVSFKYDRKTNIKAIDGTMIDGTSNNPLLEYDVKFDKVGKYYFNFSANDGFGNDSSAFNIIQVEDMTAPTITFNGPIKENTRITIKAGQAITLDFTLSDNVTPRSELVYSIIVLDVGKVMALGDNGMTIWFDEASDYEVSIVCVDNAANVAIKTFYVRAIKGEDN